MLILKFAASFIRDVSVTKNLLSWEVVVGLPAKITLIYSTDQHFTHYGLSHYIPVRAVQPHIVVWLPIRPSTTVDMLNGSVRSSAVLSGGLAPAVWLKP